MSRKANGVSKLHGEVSRHMWENYSGTCPIDHVTNAQNKNYWADDRLEEARANNDLAALDIRKKELKKYLFKEVANQTGKWFDENVLTIVWARRFAEYKRADLITRDIQRFHDLLTNKEMPVQIIFAGKPYPMDYNAIRQYDHLVELSLGIKNMAVLAGYELALSKKLKDGSDIWLNNPRVTREASGTSGMTAAMNGSLNLSTNDGWIREFDEICSDCSFVLPIVDHTIPHFAQDQKDLDNLYNMLNDEIIPLYYNDHNAWNQKVINSMSNVVPFFDSDRMAHDYYVKMYS